MRLILLLSCLPLVLCKTGEYEKSEGIYILNNGNYESAVGEFDYIFVYFYAPWCGHCKALGPEFVKAGQMLREKDSLIKLAKVDGTEETEILDKENVTGYPTLKLYRKGEMVPYTGGRMAPEMVDWLEKKISPPAQILETLEDVKEFLSKSEVSVIGFFTQDGEKKSMYETACKDYDDYGVHYPVGMSSSKEVLEKYSEKEGIVLFKKFDEFKVIYSGDYSTQSIRDFITEESLPNVIEFNHENAQKLFKSPNNGKSHLLVFHNSSLESFKDEFSMLRRVGKEFKKQVLFVSVDVVEEDHRRMIEFLGVRHRINNDTFPTMRIITMKDNSGPVRFRPEDTTVSEENIRTFVSEYISGKVPREYFVEPLPENWDETPVKYLTAVNLKKFVEDESKNALVMFHAPWCGHCKTLSPGIPRYTSKLSLQVYSKE